MTCYQCSENCSRCFFIHGNGMPEIKCLYCPKIAYKMDYYPVIDGKNE